jgi:hypothetical protein
VPQNLLASQNSTSCSDRYVTFVNPVRGRERWRDNSIKPLNNQYTALADRDLAATWLLQYDAIDDSDVVGELYLFDSDQELGLFLEVSPNLAKDADVYYPHATPWDDPNAVFLSGYERKERVAMLDTLFGKFKETFGYYPSSVGAWWIDSYSLDYISQKYGVKAAMIVADQKTTDDYGVWGQWWGVPYYPSEANILVPASSQEDKLDVVVTQWAQRDITKAYGEGPKISNFSLQANDYIKQGKDTSYFINLVENYLDCRNPVGQVTVGLETGMESVTYLDEYVNQLDSLLELKDIDFVTLSEFYAKYKNVFPEYPEKYVLDDGTSSWLMTPEFRENEVLGDKIIYSNGISFSDYFVKDDSKFLNRRLPLENKNGSDNALFVVFVLGLLLIGIYKLMDKKTFSLGLLTLLLTYGLALRAKESLGWRVFYSFKQDNLLLTKIFLIFLAFLIAYAFKKLVKKDWKIWFLPLSFGLIPMFEAVRVSKLAGEYLFGVALSNHRFAGFGFKPPFDLRLILEDFPAAQAAALLRIDYIKYLSNASVAIIIFPLVQIILSFVLIFIFNKLTKKAKLIMAGILIYLMIVYIYQTLTSDPVFAWPI